MVIAFLVATAVLGAKPTFQDVLKKFPAATLPLRIKEPSTQKLELTAADADALGFLKNTSASLAGLRKWKEPAYVDPDMEPEKKVLWPVAAIQRANAVLLLVRYDDLSHLYQTQETFLLSYDAKGVLLGGSLFHASNAGEAGGQSDESTLSATGEILRSITASYPLHEGEPMPEQLVTTGEQRAKLTSTGALESMPMAWSKPDGLFVDRQSKEELLVIGKRVFYRAKKDKPSQELEGDGKTVRFKGSPKPYVLTWNDRRSEVTCRNPDGRLQVFGREW